MRTAKLYSGTYEGYESIPCIAIVKYVDNLDQWDGHNMSSGSAGHHLGIRKIERGNYSGQWYVCHGSDWQGSYDVAYLIDEDEAIQLCMDNNHIDFEGLFGRPLEIFQDVIVKIITISICEYSFIATSHHSIQSASVLSNTLRNASRILDLEKEYEVTLHIHSESPDFSPVRFFTISGFKRVYLFYDSTVFKHYSNTERIETKW